MKLTREDLVVAYWIIFALIAFVEWTSGKGPEVGLMTGIFFTIVYATVAAISEIRKYWVYRVSQRYRV